MAQFDVHRNKGALRDSIPYVVVVQSSLFDRYRRRVVVPLVRQNLLPRGTPAVGARMNPVFVMKACRSSCMPWTWFQSPWINWVKWWPHWSMKAKPSPMRWTNC